MAHLGFIGSRCQRGAGCRKRLLTAGHTVTGYNRTRSKAQWLLDRGMQWGETPAAVAQAVDVCSSAWWPTPRPCKLLNLRLVC